MSVLARLNQALSPLLPLETGVFSGQAPDAYLVLTPLSDAFALFGSDAPLACVAQVRVLLYTKGNYLNSKRRLTSALLQAGFTITDRRYLGFEPDTGYHHYALDVEAIEINDWEVTSWPP